MTTLLSQTPIARRTDGLPSHAAARDITRSGQRAHQQHAVLALVRNYPNHTSNELSRYGMDRYQIARRLSELLAAGLVEKRAMQAQRHAAQEHAALTYIRATKPCPACSEERRAVEFAAEQKRRADQRAVHIARRIERAGIPKRFSERTFANFRAESDGQKRALQVAHTYAERFDDRLAHGGGLVFCGNPGTGKTHLACAVANHVLQTGRAVMFSTVIQAVRSVKETYRKDADISERQAINSLVEPDLLILDEVGVQFGSETEKLILFEILNGRYEDMRPTIVISNLPQSELGAYLGERVIDRLQEGGGVVIAFDWHSYRSHVHKDAALPTARVPAVRWDAQ